MPMNVAWSARWRLFGALRIILYVAMRKDPEPPKRLVGRPVGRPCGVAGPGVASLGPAREKILAKPNEHDSQVTVQGRRPARGERLRFLEPERRRTDRPGADREWEPARNVPQPPPFRRRSSLSDASSQSGRIPPGVLEASQLCGDQLASVVSRLLASRSAKNNSHWPRYALLTARFDSPCNCTAASSS